MENLSNTEKVEVSAIQKALDLEMLYDMTEWINMIRYGLEKMQKTIDEVIDWAALEGTDW